jgi:Na+-driven multidrug efflux pump
MLETVRRNLPANPGREVARVAVPVGLEFVLILGLELVSQIIVGGLGDAAVAAVGFALSIQLIPFFVLGALGSSASILVARAYGAKREKELNKVVSAAITVAFISGAVVAIPFVMWPSEIFQAVGGSESVVTEGSLFLALIMGSLIFGLIAQVLSGVLRSADHARSPMVATLATGVLQIPIAIVLVYGWGPIPALGVTGAGWAMVISCSENDHLGNPDLWLLSCGPMADTERTPRMEICSHADRRSGSTNGFDCGHLVWWPVSIQRRHGSAG